MSVYHAMRGALSAKNFNNYVDLLHSDYTFVRHQFNKNVSLEEWKPILEGMFKAMNEGTFEIHSSRCLYENSEILIVHDIISFPDGAKEAVLAVHSLSAGKIIRTETGATRLDES